MKPYIQMTATEKRQAVLDLLWRSMQVRHAGLPFSELKAALGATQSLSSVINTLLMRGEVRHGRRITGNQIEWLPVATTTAPTRKGPKPGARAMEPAPVPGYVHVIRLLDTPNRCRGGQGAIVTRPGLQSGMQTTMEWA